MDLLAWGLAALFTFVGLRTALPGTRIQGELSGTDRLLIAVHDAARAGFWLGLAGLFAGFALLDDPYEFRWFALIPIGMAGLRLLATVGLGRGR